MRERIGTCSICGGEVIGHRGAWWGVIPPDPDECSGCGAVRAESVIQMVPRPSGSPRRWTYKDPNGNPWMDTMTWSGIVPHGSAG